jgi:predicted MFS family arabinose efflux permease
MSAAAEAPLELASDDRLARRNALVLAVAQALAGGNNTVIVATAGIVGAMLAPEKGLATLPITTMVVGMWAGTLPVGALSKTYGRRFALQTGSVFGTLAGLISCAAMLRGSFVLLLLGTFCGGLYAAAHQSYRFAACDMASETFRPKAISWVMAGGLFAALLGPQLVIFTKDLSPPYMFAATYLAQAAVAVLAAIVLIFVRIPKLHGNGKPARPGRPLSEIAMQPRFMVAVLCGVVSYGVMNLLMTSAPLAMVMCNHSVTDASLGIQWHVLGMYAPSFFTGTLISRYGVNRVVLAGLALLASSAVVGYAGISLAHFWISLILLGVGWNFSFIGATTLVTTCHRAEERNKVQAFNDFLIFGSMAVASFASGQLLATVGWEVVNEVVLPIVVVAAILVLMTGRNRQAAAA